MSVLEHQIALVTGATRGIGRAIASTLGAAGAVVIGTATTTAGAEEISQRLIQEGIKGTGLALDVNDLTQIEALNTQINQRFGDIAILVNNAGITRDNLLLRMKEDEWDNVMDVNLKSIYRLSKAVLRGMMKARAGRIINVGSVVGSTGNAGQSNYAAAKSGMIGFSKSLAREIGSRNITVNCVSPGFIDTDMTRGLTEEQKKLLLGQIPLGRLGQVNDVAQAVLYLASPCASYVTGNTLHVNGGMYMD
ncbi:MAG: 3-oxoacyl-ACP reductase FabG [Betaproteobacteria bacterium]